jgi:hypothetical protein
MLPCAEISSFSIFKQHYLFFFKFKLSSDVSISSEAATILYLQSQTVVWFEVNGIRRKEEQCQPPLPVLIALMEFQ